MPPKHATSWHPGVLRLDSEAAYHGQLEMTKDAEIFFRVGINEHDGTPFLGLQVSDRTDDTVPPTTYRITIPLWKCAGCLCEEGDMVQEEGAFDRVLEAFWVKGMGVKLPDTAIRTKDGRGGIQTKHLQYRFLSISIIYKSTWGLAWEGDFEAMDESLQRVIEDFDRCESFDCLLVVEAKKNLDWRRFLRLCGPLVQRGPGFVMEEDDEAAAASASPSANTSVDVTCDTEKEEALQVQKDLLKKLVGGLAWRIDTLGAESAKSATGFVQGIAEKLVENAQKL